MDSGLGDIPYQHLAAAALDVSNRLRALGVEQDLAVPSLVICGDQSSGKSSVVEAIAGVSLPRSVGTCTRCPTEVRLRTAPPTDTAGISAPAPGPNGALASTAGSGDDDGAAAPKWRCRILLHRECDASGAKLPQVPPEELFVDLTEQQKERVAVCVSAAQAVLLNPSLAGNTVGGAREFVPEFRPDGSVVARHVGLERNELSFTANKVVLEIDGAEADLTIIDMPGIIHDSRSPEPGEADPVELVRGMTAEAVAPEHHIIAMALQASADPETQLVRRMAREVDPAGARSIGIITKPDQLLDDASIGRAVGNVARSGAEVAGGKRGTELQLGYYVVRNPHQDELNDHMSFAQARDLERAYFSKTPLWVQAAAASPDVARRLGAANLRQGLSELLVRRLQAQLPSILGVARAKLAAVRQQLAALPPAPPADSAMELRRCLGRTVQVLHNEIQATPEPGGTKAFYQRVASLFEAYGEGAIRATPAFLVGRTLVSALSSSERNLRLEMAAAAAAGSGSGSGSGSAAGGAAAGAGKGGKAAAQGSDGGDATAAISLITPEKSPAAAAAAAAAKAAPVLGSSTSASPAPAFATSGPLASSAFGAFAPAPAAAPAASGFAAFGAAPVFGASPSAPAAAAAPAAARAAFAPAASTPTAGGAGAGSGAGAGTSQPVFGFGYVAPAAAATTSSPAPAAHASTSTTGFAAPAAAATTAATVTAHANTAHVTAAGPGSGSGSGSGLGSGLGSDLGAAKRTAAAAGLAATREEAEAEVTDADVERAVRECEELRRDLSKALFPERFMSLPEVHALRREHLGRELRGFSPYSALEALVERFQHQFRPHALSCVTAVVEAVRAKVAEVVRQHFGRYPRAAKLVGQALASKLDQLAATARADVETLVEREESCIYTINTHYFRDSFHCFLGRLKVAYCRPPAQSEEQRREVRALLQQLSGFGVSFSCFEDAFNAQATPYDEELRLMAACLAYYKVSFKRMLDAVPLALHRSLLDPLARKDEVEASLLAGLRLDGAGAGAQAANGGLSLGLGLGLGLSGGSSAALSRIMAEDQGLAAQRCALASLEQRLGEAVEALERAEAGAEDD
ncbi:hypothetical protein HYH03_012918 [Edaphochlamys debaryana]|uniref:Uncharacterized protein n=1 Tax=Edaphochlamys debaryana TaxID=47281 RepID=A0A835XZS8_9CHLO|nr:hypothetical protein HYH03_012918 [Edaphochlamys debaryana]|eukprot:KAG2488599.1 hypothetical protein HYH03_012918 [Edaphochlamys debaryana]